MIMGAGVSLYAHINLTKTTVHKTCAVYVVTLLFPVPEISAR